MCDCRSTGQKKVASPCVGLSSTWNKSKQRTLECEALLARGAPIKFQRGGGGKNWIPHSEADQKILVGRK